MKLTPVRSLYPAFLGLAGLAIAQGAGAADAAADAAAPAPTWTFPTSISLVSDYIFRGQSQTWGKPAIQFSVEADHASGLYAGFFASNVSDNWIPGAHVETDYYGGFRGNLPAAAAEVAFDVGAIYYAYPGANWDKSNWSGFNKSNKVDTLEAYLGLTYKWLNFKTGRTLTEYFGWSTNNSPVNGGFNGDLSAGVTGNTRGSYFYEFNANYEVLPSWSLTGQLGRQIVAESTGLDITYYKAGVSKAFSAGWSATAVYSGSNTPDAYRNFLSLRNNGHDSDVTEKKLVVSVTKSF